MAKPTEEEIIKALRRLMEIADNVAMNENVGIMDSAIESAQDIVHRWDVATVVPKPPSSSES
jgi:hypothetical protein